MDAETVTPPDVSLSPTERIARARAGQPPPVKRRPQPLTELTPAQQEELQGLSLTERMTRYRQWCAEAQREP